MSSRIGTYFSIASISVFDFALGIGIAKITDYIFPAPTENDSILRLFLTSVAQLVTSMTLAYELRGLLLTERKGFYDPTGGIGFVLAIREMPTFWKRIDILTTKILDYISDPMLRNANASNGTNGGIPGYSNGNPTDGQTSSPAPTSTPSNLISMVQSTQNAGGGYTKKPMVH